MNDVQICGVMAEQPISSYMPNKDNKEDVSIQITFPVAWSRDGVISMIMVSAIQSTARKIRKYVQPGEPLLVTGRLVNKSRNNEDRMRCELRSIERLITDLPTGAIGKKNKILFLNGGQCHLLLRGSVKYNCFEVKKTGAYQNILVIKDQKNRSHHFSFISQQPTYKDQTISLMGDFHRCIYEKEDKGIIVAKELCLGVSIKEIGCLKYGEPQYKRGVEK